MSHKIRFVIHRFCLIAGLLFGTVGCDQITKLVVRDALSVTGPITYFNGSIQLEYAKNPGAFMSLGAQLPEGARFWIFNVFCSMLLAVVGFALLKTKQTHPFPVIGLTLILGGGVGNMIDRLAFGSVTDFLFIHIGPVRTGIFNIADMAIVLGVALLALSQLTRSRQKAASRLDPILALLRRWKAP